MPKRLSLYLSDEHMMQLTTVTSMGKYGNWRDFIKEKITESYKELKKYSINPS